MTPQEIEIQLKELDEKIDRLRALYESYFMGYEKLEPTVPRKDVDRRLALIRKEQIRNTAQRFRFNVLNQKYNTYAMYWMRIARQIEEGTYKRHVQKAKQRFGVDVTAPAKAAERAVEPSLDLSGLDEDDLGVIDDLFSEAAPAPKPAARAAEPTPAPMRSGAYTPAGVPSLNAKPRVLRKLGDPAPNLSAPPPAQAPAPAPAPGAPPAFRPAVRPSVPDGGPRPAPVIRPAPDASMRPPAPAIRPSSPDLSVRPPAPAIRPSSPDLGGRPPAPTPGRMPAPPPVPPAGPRGAPPPLPRAAPTPPATTSPAAPAPPGPRPAAPPMPGAGARPVIRPRVPSSPDIPGPPGSKPKPPDDR